MQQSLDDFRDTVVAQVVNLILMGDVLREVDMICAHILITLVACCYSIHNTAQSHERIHSSLVDLNFNHSLGIVYI